MLQPNTRIHPPLLRPVEMAELLAAVEGRLSHERISHALRWILPEIHEEFAAACRAALA